MVWGVYDIALVRIIESILEGVGEICDTNDEVVRIINGNNKIDSMGFKY